MTDTTGRIDGSLSRVGTLSFVLLVAAMLVLLGVRMFSSDGVDKRSVGGFQAMIDDAQEELGTTSVVKVSYYDTYAMVEVPVRGSTTRSITYQYDGDFDDVFDRGTLEPGEASSLINLRQIDFAAIVSQLDAAPAKVGLVDGLVEGIETRVGRLSSRGADTPSTFITVDTEFYESGSIQLDLRGKVVAVDRYVA